MAESRPYRPIADYAAIGNLRTVALVAPDGSIDWCCLPDFDSPSAFAALLDARRGGRFRVRPTRAGEGRQAYVPGTNVLETVFETDTGRLILTDFMPLRGDLAADAAIPRHELRRVLFADGGGLEVDVEWAPRLDYARGRTLIEQDRDGFLARHADGVGIELRLVGVRADEADIGELDGGPVVRARISLEPAQRRAVACLVGRSGEDDVLVDSRQLLDETIDAWRQWLHRVSAEERGWSRPYQELVMRSELALKLLFYAPTGAIVAAPTTSLPEHIGGVRNWDYRYSWLRDSSLTVQALHAVGHEEEARRFVLWLEDSAQQDTRVPRLVQVMYGIRGETDFDETELTHLEGYRGSRPVRIGNGAADQLQLDVYGELLDGAYELIRAGHDIPAGLAPFLAAVADRASQRLDEPDEGIWEVRGVRQHFTHSKLMLWAGLDRAVKLAEHHGLAGDVDGWRAARGRAREMIEQRGFNARLGAFTQVLDGETIDASLLRVPILELLDGTDPRVQGTIDRVLEQLTEHDLVYRYRVHETADGLPGEEGAFVLCTFWLVDALVLADRLDEAERVFDGLARRANHVGLYAEQIDPRTGAFLGNFPQAFSHLGLLTSALYLAHAKGYQTPVPQPVGTGTGRGR